MSDNYRKVKRVLWAILFANLAVAILKIVMGAAIKSTGLLADGFHSLTDGSSNIVGLIGIWFASKPVDKDHPYGHTKFEILAGLIIAGMLFFACGKIATNAVEKLRNPVAPNLSPLSFSVMLLTMIINIFVSVFERNAGKKLDSLVLISDSMHTRSDIYVTIGILAILIGIKLGLPPIIDPIASFIVCGIIFWAAYKIFKDNSDILLDKAVVDTDKIKRIAFSFEQVKDAHDIRSRGTENDLYIDMHIMTEPCMSVEESHELIHLIEDKIREEINQNVQVIAHIEPYTGNGNSH